jgi:hypothetical protein
MKIDLELATLIYGGDPLEQLDTENPGGNELGKVFDSDADAATVADPVQAFIESERTGLGKTLMPDTDPGWIAPILEKTVPGTPATFAKGTRGHRLGIVSVEEVVIDGDRWQHGYDAAGKLVAADVIAYA